MDTNVKGKHFVGEKATLYIPDARDYYVALCRTPYTVIGVSENELILQECKLYFYGDRYFDSVADEIVPDPSGRIMKVRWSARKQRWQESPAGSYPHVPIFGVWEHQPYLN